MDNKPVGRLKSPWRFVIVAPLFGAAVLLCACVSLTPPATHPTATPALSSAAAVRPTVSPVRIAPPPTSLATPAPSATESSTPTSSAILDTSNWPVYLDHQRGIQLRYPPTFFLFEDPYADGVDWLDWSVVFLDKEYQKELPPQAPGITIQAYPNPEGVDPADWLSRHSTDAPFGTEVDLEPPVLYLWPDEPVRSVTVAGREGTRLAIDAMGLRVPAILLPHERWMLEINYGDFGPDRLEPVLGSILETLSLESREPANGLTCVDLQDVSLRVCLPEGHTISRKDEQNRRGSFASFDLHPREGCQPPCLGEIQFFSRESIREFNASCDANREYPCLFGDYPDLERYHGQREALNRLENYRDYELQEVDGRYYLATSRPCYGDSCLIREYTTYVGDIKIDVWIIMDSESRVVESEQLLAQLFIQDS